MATGFPVKANYATGDVLTATNMNDLSGTVNYLQYMPPRNVLLNSNFSVWQRGTSSGTNGISTADRWFCVVGGTTTFSQDTSVPTGVLSQYSLKWTTGASSSYGQLFQAIEQANVIPLRGQTMTFSIYLKTTGTAFSGTMALKAYYSNASDAYASQTTAVGVTGSQTITPTGTWTRYSGTVTIPSDAVGFKIGLEPSVVQASGVVLYHAAAQLELGSVANTYMPNQPTYQGELAACQRYYFRNQAPSTYAQLGGNGPAATTSIIYMAYNAPVPLRVTPTSVDYGGDLRACDGVNYVTVTSVTASGGQANTPVLQVNSSAGFTTLRPYFLSAQATGNAYIGFSAEL